MKEWGIQISSEKKMRVRAAGLSENHLVSEFALFSFPLKTDGEELRPAPIVFIPHLKNKIEELLEKNHR